jgi:hypothetical protein
MKQILISIGSMICGIGSPSLANMKAALGWKASAQLTTWIGIQ